MDYILHVAKNGYLRPIMWMDGDWMWQPIQSQPNSTIISGRNSGKAVKEANPEAIILAETLRQIPRDWLQGNEWDTVMNYDAFLSL